MKKFVKNFIFVLLLCIVFSVTGCKSSDRDYDNAKQADITQAETTQTDAAETVSAETNGAQPVIQIDEAGVYTSKDDVALYIHTFGKLPSNFITKKEAKSLGWSGGGLDDYSYGSCIGGDKFGNFEGLLPDEEGRVYYECDIDTLHENSRGAKRIVFSNDGLVYYTEDHYSSFELLYN